jgi:hypothetical protein
MKHEGSEAQNVGECALERVPSPVPTTVSGDPLRPFLHAAWEGARGRPSFTTDGAPPSFLNAQSYRGAPSSRRPASAVIACGTCTLPFG